MKYMEIGKSGIKVPRLCFGSMEIGGGVEWPTNDEDSFKTLDAIYDAGLNYIDTAPVYGVGHSEEILGKFLKGKRDKIILSSKCAMNWRQTQGEVEYTRDGLTVYRNTAKNAIRTDLEESLKRLDTDYIDIYITHRQSALTPIEETMSELMQMKKEGKIRAIGISNSTTDHLKEYLKYGPVDLAQEHFSVLNRDFQREYFPLCEQNGVTMQVYRVIERGLLTGKIGMDYKVAPGSAHQKVLWFDLDRRSAVLKMLDELKPMAPKYGTSLANIFFAHSLQMGDFINPLCGSRRAETILDTIKMMDFTLEQCDFDLIEKLSTDILNTFNVKF